MTEVNVETSHLCSEDTHEEGVTWRDKQVTLTRVMCIRWEGMPWAHIDAHFCDR